MATNKKFRRAVMALPLVIAGIVATLPAQAARTDTAPDQTAPSCGDCGGNGTTGGVSGEVSSTSSGESVRPNEDLCILVPGSAERRADGLISLGVEYRRLHNGRWSQVEDTEPEIKRAIITEARLADLVADHSHNIGNLGQALVSLFGGERMPHATFLPGAQFEHGSRAENWWESCAPSIQEFNRYLTGWERPSGQFIPVNNVRLTQ